MLRRSRPARNLARFAARQARKKSERNRIETAILRALESFLVEPRNPTSASSCSSWRRGAFAWRTISRSCRQRKCWSGTCTQRCGSRRRGWLEPGHRGHRGSTEVTEKDELLCVLRFVLCGFCDENLSDWPMSETVFSAALRQAGSASRAEDVTQTVFTDLARKADVLSERRDLAGWLPLQTADI